MSFSCHGKRPASIFLSIKIYGTETSNVFSFLHNPWKENQPNIEPVQIKMAFITPPSVPGCLP